MIYKSKSFAVPEEKIVRVIVDTDAKNEADDQFAIVQAMLSPKFDNVGFIAAHFGKDGSMRKSYEELELIFKIAGCPHDDLIKHGAEHALCSKTEPEVSEGAELIVSEAMKDDPRPLYVLSLGAITDLASAYLMEPRIAKRLTAIWIGGGAYPYGGREFNLCNDINAANVVFSSGLDLWQVPKNVYEMMAVSFTELAYRIAGKNAVGDYLFRQLCEENFRAVKSNFRSGETWVLGDSPAVGLVLYEHRFCFDYTRAPEVGLSGEYLQSQFNPPIRVYRSIDSRLVLEDFYAKVALFDPEGWR